MSDTATALISGPVLAVESRQGTSIRDGQPSAWNRTSVRILVASRDVTEVTIPEGVRAPIEGEDVDLLVEFRPYSDRNGSARLGCRAVSVLTGAKV